MADEQQSQANLIGELRSLKSLVEETADSLRSQRDILRQRGMSLPPMALKATETLNTELARLEDGILGEQTELGQLRSLADTSALINSSLDLDNVLQQAMDVVITLTNAERGYIILADKNTGELVFRVIRESELLPKQGGNPELSQTILRDVITTGEPLLADNAYKDDRLQGGASIAQLNLRSVLCVPLKYKEAIIGIVYVDNRLRSGVFTEREKNLLSAFANQASVAIENARLFSAIQQALVEIGEMKSLMDNVFASIGSGVITADANHKIMTVNRAAAHIVERDADELVGRKLTEVMPDTNIDLDIYLNEVNQNDARQVLDTEMQVPERGRIAINMKLTPLKDARQATQGIAMVLDDVTEQVEAEQVMGVMRRYLPPQMVENIHSIAQIGLGGERREVTCMFGDVRPVATFPEDFRPQQIMEELNVYLARATNCIHQCNGIVDKYMGNEIMALFNTQLNPMQDHALKALETALLIRDAFLELYAELGINPTPHFYRIGMHTGVATLGNVGSLSRREFTAIGDTINLSKRLEENAQSGQIIISEATRQHLEPFLASASFQMRFEEREPVQVKGRQQKTRIYEVFKV